MRAPPRRVMCVCIYTSLFVEGHSLYTLMFVIVDVDASLCVIDMKVQKLCLEHLRHSCCCFVFDHDFVSVHDFVDSETKRSSPTNWFSILSPCL